jgi:hypothetical protein
MPNLLSAFLYGEKAVAHLIGEAADLIIETVLTAQEGP